MKSTFQITLMAFLLLASCKNQPRKITFEIPENFQGVIHIYKSIKDEPKPIDDKEVRIVVPESGVVFTDQYEVFDDWHQTNVNSKNDTGKSFYLFDMGEINHKYMIYFYGDVDVYEKQISKISVFDLKPGRFP